MRSSLTLRAGPRAIAIIRERGLRGDDIDVIPAASGGAKWLSIAGLDKYLFGQLLGSTPAVASSTRPLRCIGSSIGSWRMACLAQRDPVAALERGHRAYIYDQHYSPKPHPREITERLTHCLDMLLGANGVDEMLSHPFVRLHILTAHGRGLAATPHRVAVTAAVAIAAAANVLSRRSLALQFRRTLFHDPRDAAAFSQLRDQPTAYLALGAHNVRDALIASGSIPLLIEGARITGQPGALHWDGGVVDYHLDLDFGDGDGLVLFPHFYPYVVPGWFDKALPWRRAGARNFGRTLLIAPSAEFVATLPGKKIPDRHDFKSMSNSAREKAWQTVANASAQLGEELHELITTGRVVSQLTPW